MMKNSKDKWKCKKIYLIIVIKEKKKNINDFLNLWKIKFYCLNEKEGGNYNNNIKIYPQRNKMPNVDQRLQKEKYSSTSVSLGIKKSQKAKSS